MITLQNFFQEVVEQQKTNLDKALAFAFFVEKTTGQKEFTGSSIAKYFVECGLAKQNTTDLTKKLKDCNATIKGGSSNTLTLTVKCRNDFEGKWGSLFSDAEITIEDALSGFIIPFISAPQRDDAKKMAELYYLIHLFENSVREFIKNTLENAIGANWWNSIPNKIQSGQSQRIAKEQQQKWMPPRGHNPLFYVDWTDMVTIISHPNLQPHFQSKIPDVNFVTIRLGELGTTRNIIAHNGVIPDYEDFKARIIRHLKDWSNQIK